MLSFKNTVGIGTLLSLLLLSVNCMFFGTKIKLLWSIYLQLSLTILALLANPDVELLQQQARWHYFATGKKTPLCQQSVQSLGYKDYFRGNSQLGFSVLGLVLPSPFLTHWVPGYSLLIVRTLILGFNNPR